MFFRCLALFRKNNPSANLQLLKFASTNRSEYYIKIGNENVDDADVKPDDWEKALPFKSIPGPKPWPIIGNAWRFAPPFGEFSNMSVEIANQKLLDTYGKIVMMDGMFNPPMVFLYDPKDYETVYRNAGAWPIRDSLPSFAYYRTVLRKEMYEKFPGVAVIQGEEWFRCRSMVNPVLMQPRVVGQKVPEINAVTHDFVELIKHLTEKHKDGVMADNFMGEIHKWSLESMGALALDRRLGCLDINLSKDSETSEMIKTVLTFFELMYELDYKPSLWRFINTPKWKKFVKSADLISSLNMKYISEAMVKLEAENNDKPENEKSALERLIKIDPQAAIVTALDMMVGGVETTGSTLASALYILAKNPEKQKKLLDESMEMLPNKDTPVSSEILEKMHYTKAVVKETLRLLPTGPATLRTTTKDLVLNGYQVPKGTHVLCQHLLTCRREEQFKRALEFIPERWLRTNKDEFSHKNAHPFAYLPFGHGPRTCIGKRMATMELEVAVAKIVRNFELSWPHAEDAHFEQKLLYGITSPLKLKFKPIQG